MLRSLLPRRVLIQRQLLGISQRTLAERAGVSVATLCKIEAGQSADLKLSVLLRISSALHVSPDYLLGFDKPADTARRMVPLGSFPLRHDGDGAVGPQKCPWCDSLLSPYREHSQGECILMNHERGKSVETLAAAYALTLESIFTILREEQIQLKLRT